MEYLIEKKPDKVLRLRDLVFGEYFVFDSYTDVFRVGIDNLEKKRECISLNSGETIKDSQFARVFRVTQVQEAIFRIED